MTRGTEVSVWDIDLRGEIVKEAARAVEKHGPFHSFHEGHAVLHEEFDELWDEIKAQDQSPERIYEEAIQVAAMGLRLAAFAKSRMTKVVSE